MGKLLMAVLLTWFLVVSRAEGQSMLPDSVRTASVDLVSNIYFVDSSLFIADFFRYVQGKDVINSDVSPTTVNVSSVALVIRNNEVLLVQPKDGGNKFDAMCLDFCQQYIRNYRFDFNGLNIVERRLFIDFLVYGDMNRIGFKVYDFYDDAPHIIWKPLLMFFKGA